MLSRDELAEDPGPPYLFVDVYPFDFDDSKTYVIEDPPWEAAFAHSDVFGAILKFTDGMQYGFVDWAVRNYKKLIELLGARRGKTALLGGYHYTQFLVDGAQQAEYYLRSLELAGWSGDDIVPIVDVEAGPVGSANRKASRQQVIDVVSEMSGWLTARTGRGTMLYGRGLLRDQSIPSKMGCDRVWDPAYTRLMVVNGLVGKLPDGTPAPWTLDEIVLWQLAGDGQGDSAVTHIATTLSGFAHGDISVAEDGARATTWQVTRRRLTAAKLLEAA